VIVTPNAETHEKWNLIAAAIIGMYMLMQKPQYFDTIPEVGVFIFSILIGTFYLNPDLDTGSRARKRWWIFSFIWKPFNHRGILHNPLLYAAIFALSFGVPYVTPPQYAMYAFYAPYLTGGIAASALVHIIADKVMDIMHVAEKII
jgi:uncharacterized metal-binding protein